MKPSYIQALAKVFQNGDNRLSFDVALTEAILNRAIIVLDSKGKIPASRLIDNSK